MAVAEDKQDNETRLFPNPGNNQITLNIPKEIQHATIKIYNMLGDIVLQSTLANPLTAIDVSALPQGIYFACITDGKQYQNVQKFVKQ